MASEWGRKETIIWPPHVPIWSFYALAEAFLMLLGCMWYRVNVSMTMLQRSYIGEYALAGAGAQFQASNRFAVIYLGTGGAAKPRPRRALPVDFTDGDPEAATRKQRPVTLSSFATALGYKTYFRGSEEKLPDASVNRWLRGVVYGNKGFFQLFVPDFETGGVCLAALLVLALPADLRRFKSMKYGRVLRGPAMMTPKQFNRKVYKVNLRWRKIYVALHNLSSVFVNAWMAFYSFAFRGEWFRSQWRMEPLPEPPHGIGFKTTEMKDMMRIPIRKESQHFQIMGDTGVGKTQLIMQILRQIRQRGDVAIVYDPAREYVEKFYDERRGDYILNPLDSRTPYWAPAQEMGSNEEADAIAASLYSPKTDVKDEFFHDTPAQVFAHLLKKGPTPHEMAEWMADANKLEELVAGTEMSFYIDRKAGPQRAGVLSSLGLVAKSLRLLPRKEETTRTWNARQWSQQRKGWIFITSRPTERETLRPLHSLWIDLLVMRLLSTPQPGQRQVWFVIDELASLQKLPQLHTAIVENRKSKNPLVLGFQGKAQLEVIYGHLAEVMLSSPATKIFMKTGEPDAAKWISQAIGEVEIERVKETKFDGSRSGKNFTLDRQIEPLVIPSEITGLEDRHAFLKLGNNVARFDFDYLDLPKETSGFVPRNSAAAAMAFDPDTLEQRVPATPKSTPVPLAAVAVAVAEPAAVPPSEGAPIDQHKAVPLQWPIDKEAQFSAELQTSLNALRSRMDKKIRSRVAAVSAPTPPAPDTHATQTEQGETLQVHVSKPSEEQEHEHSAPQWKL